MRCFREGVVWDGVVMRLVLVEWEKRVKTHMMNPIALKVLLETAGKMTDKVSPKRTTKATLTLASYLFYT
jgi:hypothetical protein